MVCHIQAQQHRSRNMLKQKNKSKNIDLTVGAIASSLAALVGKIYEYKPIPIVFIKYIYL